MSSSAPDEHQGKIDALSLFKIPKTACLFETSFKECSFLCEWNHVYMELIKTQCTL